MPHTPAAPVPAPDAGPAPSPPPGFPDGLQEAPDAARLGGPLVPADPPGGDEEGGDGADADGRDGSGVGLATRTRTRTKKPSMYRVMLLNDDYTPMEFVVMVLEQLFNKSPEEATRIMLHVHQKGVGTCGVFTYEVAETKVALVLDVAKRHQHPLQCIMEKED